MNSRPESSPVRFALCRRIDDLDLADSDFDVEHDPWRSLASCGQRGGAVDADPAVVLAEEADLSETSVSVELGRCVAWQRHEDVTDTDRGLDGAHGSTIEVQMTQVEPELTDPEVVVVVEVGGRERC